MFIDKQHSVTHTIVPCRSPGIWLKKTTIKYQKSSIVSPLHVLEPLQHQENGAQNRVLANQSVALQGICSKYGVVV